MENTVYRIRRKTAEKISKAIRIFHINHGKIISGKIPIKDFAKVLREGVITTTAPEATEEEYVIRQKTLKDVGDAVRDIGGLTGQFNVGTLDQTIKELAIQLPSPFIDIFCVQADESEEVEISNALIQPIIQIITVEQARPPTEDLSLNQPDIVIIEANVSEELEDPNFNQLEPPTITIIKVAKEQAPETGSALSQPQIQIVKAEVAAAEDVIPQIIQLNNPNIKIQTATKIRDEEKESSELEQPSVCLVSADREEEQAPAPEIIHLVEPKICIFAAEKQEDSGDIIPAKKLRQPHIKIVAAKEGGGDGEGDIEAEELAQPFVKIVYATKAEEEAPAQESMLKKPSIVLEKAYKKDTGEEEQKGVPLGTPNIDIFKVSVSDDPTVTPSIKQLDQPQVSIVKATIYSEDTPDANSELQKPAIALVLAQKEGDQDNQEEAGILDAPDIIIEKASTEDMPPVEPGKDELASPIIAITEVSVVVDDGEQEKGVLAQPIICLTKAERPYIDEPIKEQVLRRPIIKLLWVFADDEEEPEQSAAILDAPHILVVEVNAEYGAEETPEVPKLTQPEISIVEVNAEHFGGEVSAAQTLEQPSIALVEITKSDSDVGTVDSELLPPTITIVKATKADGDTNVHTAILGVAILGVAILGNK